MSPGLGRSGNAVGFTRIAQKPSADNPEPPTSIQDLPTELLATVFEAGASITFDDCRRGLHFIIAMSHVCRHWRATAYSFSDAWCYVPIHTKRDAMTMLFLARSAGRPIDVCLYLDEDTSSVSLRETMRLVSPTAPYWICLYIRPREWWNLFYHVGTLRKLENMVRLRGFDLQFCYWLESGGPKMPPDLLGIALLPTLESVVCVGAAITYRSPVFCGLTSLTLAHIDRPSHAEFRALCLQNPQLEYLYLQDALPKIIGDYLLAWGPFVLSSLQTLHIAMMDMHENETYMVTFFGALKVPALLELGFSSNLPFAWQGFQGAIHTWDEDLFWGLRILCLEVLTPVEFQVKTSPRLFHKFPMLENFEFRTSDDLSVPYFLREWISETIDGDGSFPRIWSQLKTLIIHAPHDIHEEVKDMLDLLQKLRSTNGQNFEQEVCEGWAVTV